MALNPPASHSPPDGPCGIAFKEWAGICRALGEGRQSLLLRKGGIAEGPGGFRPEHPAFWLYPTFVHQQEQGLRDVGPPPGPGSTLPIDVLVAVETVAWVADRDRLPALEPFHIWTAATVEKRFAYRTPGLWVLGVRAYRLGEPHRVTPTPEQAGCKTWVELDPPLSTQGLRPVEGDAAASLTREAIGVALTT